MSLELAIKYAKKNPIRSRGRNSISRFCTVLTNGRNTFLGFNSWKSCPLQARFATVPERIHTHSEIAALAKAIKGPYRDLSGYTMYVARVLADGRPGLARPCPGCMSALHEFGVGRLEYTT